jgi:hypothetical protein
MSTDQQNPGIIEGISNTLSNAAHTVGEWIGVAEHKTKEELHAEERKVNTEIAGDGDMPLSDRAKAAVRAVKEGSKELNESEKKEYHKQQADATSSDEKGVVASVKDYVVETAESVGEWISETAKEAEHKTKEEANKVDRKVNTEIAKDGSLPLTDRAKAAGTAVKDGAKETAEGIKKDYHHHKAENA